MCSLAVSTQQYFVGRLFPNKTKNSSPASVRDAIAQPKGKDPHFLIFNLINRHWCEITSSSSLSKQPTTGGDCSPTKYQCSVQTGQILIQFLLESSSKYTNSCHSAQFKMPA